MTRALLFFVLLAGAAAAAPGQTLSADGLGPVTIGMNTDQLKQALQGRLPYPGGCRVLLSPTKDTIGVSLVIDNGHLARIDVDFYGTDPHPVAIKTEAGIGLTSSEEDLLKAYAGRTRLMPAPLDPSWHTIHVATADRARGMVFETNGKTVKSIRVGEYPAISYPDACK
jgi:hypothetical protein